MDLDRLRFSEYVPPASAGDVRRLRGLRSSWARPIDESSVDGLMKRAGGVVRALAARGRGGAAAELERKRALLERADALASHALRVETFAQLYRALAALHADLVSEDPGAHALEEESLTWLQAGALENAPLSSAHGPAFRETIALRNRAFRSLEAAIAHQTRALLARETETRGTPARGPA